MSAAETATRLGEIRERAEFVPPLDSGSGPQIAAWAASAVDVPDLLDLVGVLRSALRRFEPFTRDTVDWDAVQLPPDEAAVLRWALGES